MRLNHPLNGVHSLSLIRSYIHLFGIIGRHRDRVNVTGHSPGAGLSGGCARLGRVS